MASQAAGDALRSHGAEHAHREDALVPLCVDCDGTLVRTDLLHESVFLLLKTSPWKLLWLPFWLMRGKAYLKQRLAELVVFDWATLPLNDEVVELIRRAREAGRPVVLTTAAHRLLADGLCGHLALFDEVIATEKAVNLSGSVKAARLVERFGSQGFDYVGNAADCLPVWQASRSAIIVSANESLAGRAMKIASVGHIIRPPRPTISSYMRALRVHQWVKNLLVFVPLLAAQQISSGEGLRAASFAFIAFSLCASAVYVLNDLLDLGADRRHKHKRNRPFAAGLIPVWHGAVLVPILLALAFTVATLLPLEFFGILSGYFLFTLAYSVVLKRQVIVDVMMLAGLYTLRVVAGGAATGIVPSFWLLAFSMFVFLSLAIVKRYSELLETLQENTSLSGGRGYSVSDLPVLMAIGTSAGLVSVVVFALYINNPDTEIRYESPFWLWLVPPLLLYWFSRLWMKTHRGEIDDDPVVFAIRDWQSFVVLVVSGCFFVLAQ
jgi:4-hydroxybenzoate polyprenyltransferase